jgi:AcrR family transcriptional regulator
VGLLYRYFPSKQAVVIALYDELSTEYAGKTAGMPAGRWRDRFVFALNTSLHVLKPHRVALRALTPVLVGDPEEGIFAASTAFSRLRVQRVFEDAVTGAADGTGNRHWRRRSAGFCTRASGRAASWWLLDKAPISARRRRSCLTQRLCLLRP